MPVTSESRRQRGIRLLRSSDAASFFTRSELPNQMPDYIVVSADSATTKPPKNKVYWRLMLREAGSCDVVPGVAWSECIERLPAGDRELPPVGSVLRDVDVTVGAYNGKSQVTLNRIGLIVREPSQEDLSAFRTPSVVDPELTSQFLFDWPWPRDLKVLLDGVRQYLSRKPCPSGHGTLWDRFLNVPGGSKNHHSARSGLLQHTREMVEIAESLIESPYTNMIRKLVDWPILRAAIVLHDLGKLHEYDPETLGYGATLPGEALGHPQWCVAVIELLWPDFGSESRKLRLQHAVLCHHGRALSPVTPHFAEASLVHFIDGISATMSVYRDKPGEFNGMIGGTPVVFTDASDA